MKQLLNIKLNCVNTNYNLPLIDKTTKFTIMSSVKKTAAKVPTKGARLKWEPLNTAQPVKLTNAMMQGKIVSPAAKSNSAYLVS